MMAMTTPRRQQHHPATVELTILNVHHITVDRHKNHNSSPSSNTSTICHNLLHQHLHHLHRHHHRLLVTLWVQPALLHHGHNVAQHLAVTCTPSTTCTVAVQHRQPPPPRRLAHISSQQPPHHRCITAAPPLVLRKHHTLADMHTNNATPWTTMAAGRAMQQHLRSRMAADPASRSVDPVSHAFLTTTA
jgi:hypothetical protein